MKPDLRKSLGRAGAISGLIWAFQHIPLSGGEAFVFGGIVILSLVVSEDI